MQLVPVSIFVGLPEDQRAAGSVCCSPRTGSPWAVATPARSAPQRPRHARAVQRRCRCAALLDDERSQRNERTVRKIAYRARDTSAASRRGDRAGPCRTAARWWMRRACAARWSHRGRSQQGKSHVAAAAAPRRDQPGGGRRLLVPGGALAVVHCCTASGTSSAAVCACTTSTNCARSRRPQWSTCPVTAAASTTCCCPGCSTPTALCRRIAAGINLNPADGRSPSCVAVVRGSCAAASGSNAVLGCVQRVPGAAHRSRRADQILHRRRPLAHQTSARAQGRHAGDDRARLSARAKPVVFQPVYIGYEN